MRRDHSRAQRRVRLLSVLLFPMILALSGCGNYVNGRTVPKTTKVSLSAVDNTDTDGYTCPSSDNIRPDYAWQLDGTGYFKACINDTSPNALKIHPSGNASGRICVFPALYYSQNMITPVLDPSGGLRKLCVTQSQYGNAVNFPEEDYFNFLFIVREQYVNQLEVCLMSGVYTNCPQDFSYGQIRH